MKISSFSVSRPVTVIMFFSGIILLGLICWMRLPQELFPHITYPQLTIVTTYENAAPEEVESQITKIIEESIGTVSGLRQISSISKEGVSIVIAEFLWGTNMDFAALALREKIDIVKERLPIDSEEPVVKKFNPFDLPTMSLSVTGPFHLARLRDITESLIEDELEKLEGVASARVIGGVEREILVEVDQDKLQASGVAMLDVTRSIREANINYPAGTIKETFTEYLVRTLGEFQEISEIEKITVDLEDFDELRQQSGRFPSYKKQLRSYGPEDERARQEKKLIRLSDIGSVKNTYKDISSISRFNGKENVSILIQKQ
ncbi:MAG: efflux RND transporter permease subunit, partial [Candidatus Omnitrophota bacterium]